MITPLIDLRADLNAEDDEGLNWLSYAMRARACILFRVRSWSRVWLGSAVVRIAAVDEDGMVHAARLSRARCRPDRYGLCGSSGPGTETQHECLRDGEHWQWCRVRRHRRGDDRRVTQREAWPWQRNDPRRDMCHVGGPE